MYKGDAGFVLAMLKVHERVASGMIRVQNARGKLHDVKLRAQLLRLLTAYHPFWLRLGLEIVLGMSLPGVCGGGLGGVLGGVGVLENVGTCRT